jgi:hypothetical protein
MWTPMPFPMLNSSLLSMEKNERDYAEVWSTFSGYLWKRHCACHVMFWCSGVLEEVLVLFLWHYDITVCEGGVCEKAHFSVCVSSHEDHETAAFTYFHANGVWNLVRGKAIFVFYYPRQRLWSIITFVNVRIHMTVTIVVESRTARQRRKEMKRNNW